MTPEPREASSEVTPERGLFVISLDFELHWGVRDKLRVRDYRENLLGEWEVVPALLKLFTKFGIHATWATVGFLFFESKSELLRNLPQKQPYYLRRKLSPYASLTQIGESERDDPFHYAPSLIRQIAATSTQEIATHTLSHYYCLERGHDKEAFRADVAAALKVAREKHGITIRSIVFPKNQVERDSLLVCRDLEIMAYRGTPTSWLYTPRSDEHELTIRRGLRLLDSYIPISGTNAYDLTKQVGALPCNVPASRFLRARLSAQRGFEPLRLRRITNDLTVAAEEKRLYHLWWHPHDFGARPKENLAFLSRILERFATLRQQHDMQSVTMLEAAALLTTNTYE